MAILIIVVCWQPALAANDTNTLLKQFEKPYSSSKVLPGYDFYFDRVNSSAPSVYSISPNHGVRSEKINASVAGSNFGTGAQVSLIMTGQTNISTSVTDVTSSRIQCEFTLASTIAIGYWDVYVQNPDGGNVTLSNGFEVREKEAAYPENYTFERSWGSSGSNNSEFKWPSGIACDTNGSVYVVERDNNRVQKFDRSGKFLTKWGMGGGNGTAGTGNGEFTRPEGITVDSSGNVYVMDTRNNWIQMFNSAGVFQKSWTRIVRLPWHLILKTIGMYLGVAQSVNIIPGWYY